MKKFILTCILIFGILSISIFAFTPQDDINMRSFYAMWNATNISVVTDVCITGGNCLSNVTGSGTTYTGGAGIIVTGTEINVSADTCGSGNFSKFNGTKFNCEEPAASGGDITAVNTNGPYLSGGTTSGVANLLLNESYLNTSINAISTIYNDSMKTYTDATFITLANEANLNVNSSGFWDALNTPADITGLTSTNIASLDWTKLQNYPSACPANSYVTTIGDTTTCTGISDVYLLNTGDTATGNYTFSSGTFDADTLNTGQGDYELYAMNQDVESSDAVTFISVNTGQGAYELYAMNQDVESSDAVTFITLDTGEGANELFDMDQNVLTTSSVTFNNLIVSTNINSVDTIKFESDTTNHLIHDNLTCIIIEGDTSTFNIC